MILNRIAGRYKLEAIRPDGSRRLLADWFPNIVTDAGLEYLGTSSSTNNLAYCQIGSGNSTPLATDTTLDSFVASSNSATTLKGIGSGSPYYSYWRRTYNFPAGTATGLTAEIGVGWAASGSLFSRALVLDLDGNPTTVQVLADEQLNVVYECRLYAYESDATGQVTLDSVVYNYTMRGCQLDAVETDGALPGWYLPSTTGWNMRQYRSSYRVYDGSIGPLTSNPGGASDLISGQQLVLAYVPASLQMLHRIKMPQSEGVLTNGIKSLWVQLGPTCYQCEFDTAIPKTALHTLDLDFYVSWGRLP